MTELTHEEVLEYLERRKDGGATLTARSSSGAETIVLPESCVQIGPVSTAEGNVKLTSAGGDFDGDFTLPRDSGARLDANAAVLEIDRAHLKVKARGRESIPCRLTFVFDGAPKRSGGDDGTR